MCLALDIKSNEGSRFPTPVADAFAHYQAECFDVAQVLIWELTKCRASPKANRSRCHGLAIASAVLRRSVFGSRRLSMVVPAKGGESGTPYQGSRRLSILG